MTTRRLGPDDATTIDALAAAHPFKSYRSYRVHPRIKQTAILRREIGDTLALPNGQVWHVEDTDGEAMVVARVLDWETNFFGLPMARVEYVLGSTRDLRRQALLAGLAALRGDGIQHVSARVDVADVDLMTIAEDEGFRLMDALVTYTTRPVKEPPNAVREVGRIREFRDEDTAQILEITEAAYRNFRGRFHLDPHIDDSRCHAFYIEWARQSVAMNMAAMLLVSEGADHRLLGYLAFQRREPVSEVGGIPVFGGGLGACRREAPGAYAGLIRAGTVWAHEHGGVAECQTQNYNFPTIRIYEAVGAHYVRAEYTLHAWLG